MDDNSTSKSSNRWVQHEKTQLPNMRNVELLKDEECECPFNVKMAITRFLRCKSFSC